MRAPKEDETHAEVEVIAIAIVVAAVAVAAVRAAVVAMAVVTVVVAAAAVVDASGASASGITVTTSYRCPVQALLGRAGFLLWALFRPVAALIRTTSA